MAFQFKTCNALLATKETFTTRERQPVNELLTHTPRFMTPRGGKEASCASHLVTQGDTSSSPITLETLRTFSLSLLDHPTGRQPVLQQKANLFPL